MTTRLNSLLVTALIMTVGAVATGPVLAQTDAAKKPVDITVNASRVHVITGTGKTEAAKTSDIAPLVAGRVEKIFVDIGDSVKKGQKLFAIRDVNYRLNLEVAKAKLAQAKAQEKKAQITFDRTQRLYKRGVSSRADLDEITSVFDSSKAAVKAAEVAVDQARQSLDDTIVTAPFDGVVTERYMDEGENPSGATPGVVQIQKIDTLTVVVRVPARDAVSLQPGTPVRLRIDGVDAPVHAKVTVIKALIETASRIAQVRIMIPNPGLVIRPGQYVAAEFTP